LEFYNCIEEYNLLGLKWIGQHFTWCNNCTDDMRVYPKIERGSGNEAWNNMLGVIS